MRIIRNVRFIHREPSLVSATGVQYYDLPYTHTHTYTRALVFVIICIHYAESRGHGMGAAARHCIGPAVVVVSCQFIFWF